MKLLTGAIIIISMGLAPSSLGLAPSAVMAGNKKGNAPQKYQGVVNGFGELRNDDVLDLAIVFPSLTQEQILSFDFTSLLAPNEKMSAGPIDTDVPGNTYVPRQRESYGWFPLTIVKDRFSVMLPANSQQELFSMSFQAPFNETVGKARAKAPKNEIIKLASFENFGFESARDWSRVAQPFQTNLGFSRPNTSRISWSRSRLQDRASDLILQLEETPLGRWVMSDMDLDPRNSSALRSTRWSGSKKLLVGRATFNEDDKFLSLLAWVPNLRSSLNLSGLPEALEGIDLAGSSRVVWNPSDKKGFVTLYVERTAQVSKNIFQNFSEVFFNFPNFGEIFKNKSESQTFIQNWVPVEAGKIALDRPLGEKDSVALIFMGGAEMNTPDLKNAEELQVFDLRR